MDRNKRVYYPFSEVTTFLLPVTVGCSHNACAFCNMYKDDGYAEVSLGDIDMQLMNGDPLTERVFLTGADPLSIGYQKMKDLLDRIQRYFPYCACVAAYASIREIDKYSEEELSVLHDAGLRKLYIGFESGSDAVLKKMKKGHTAAQAIRTAQKLNAARIPFKTIIIYGIAGAGGSQDNAIATARMINEFTTERIVTMNLAVFEGAELQSMINSGEFVMASPRERVEEVRTLLKYLEPKESTVFDTTHPHNLIRMRGVLPRERETLMEYIATVLRR